MGSQPLRYDRVRSRRGDELEPHATDVDHCFDDPGILDEFAIADLEAILALILLDRGLKIVDHDRDLIDSLDLQDHLPETLLKSARKRTVRTTIALAKYSATYTISGIVDTTNAAPPFRRPGSAVSIVGHGGTDLSARVAGPANAAPIVFLHGYSLSSLVWDGQIGSDLAVDHRLVAPDLRGHGESDAPAGAYGDPTAWAGDVLAVLDQLQLDRPVIVAWSYSGLVLGDFLAGGGESRVRGIVLVAAALRLGPLPPMPSGDPFFDLVPALVSEDRDLARAADETFVDLLTATPLDSRFRGRLLATVAVVRPDVRRGLIERTVNNIAAFNQLGVPALVVHGTTDRLLPPIVSSMNAEALGGIGVSTYPGIGHSPFIEDPGRFNSELRGFVAMASGHAA